MNPSSVGLPPPSTRERLIRLWRHWKMDAHIEGWYPVVVGVVCGVLIWRGSVDKSMFDKLLKDAIPSAIAVAAIFAGFQGAIHAVLLSMLRSRVVRAMRQGDGDPYQRLIGYMRAGFATLILFVAAALTIVVLYDLGKLPDTSIRWVSSLCAGLFAWSLLASVRISMIEVSMLKAPDE